MMALTGLLYNWFSMVVNRFSLVVNWLALQFFCNIPIANVSVHNI